MPTRQDLTPAEVAHELNISAHTARKYLREGRINYYRLNYSTRSPMRVTRAALEEFKRRRQE